MQMTAFLFTSNYKTLNEINTAFFMMQVNKNKFSDRMENVGGAVLLLANERTWCHYDSGCITSPN